MKRGQRVKILFFFSKRVFLGDEGRTRVIPPLSKGVFWVGLGEVIFWGGWGLSQGLVFQARKVGVFFCFPRNYFFGGVGWGGWKKRWARFKVRFKVKFRVYIRFSVPYKYNIVCLLFFFIA
jgi:hypothetical protein